MAKNFLLGNSKNAPVTTKINNRQVKNSAGGYVFKVDPITMLRRFLVLGISGGTYYASESTLLDTHAANLEALFIEDELGIKAVDEICSVSVGGKASNNDPAILAMALACSSTNDKVRTYALSKANSVLRIGTHLFTFATYVSKFRGWGKGLHRALARFYLNREINNLALQVCKYPKRRVEGEPSWSHRDILRKIHLKPTTKDHALLFKYVVGGVDKLTAKEYKSLSKNKNLKYIWAHEEAKKATSEAELIELITKHNLVRESIPKELFGRDVYVALLPHMPLTAMIRSLGSMAASGLFAPLSDEVKIVVKKLQDEDELKKQRIHPLQLLVAKMIYERGHGEKGSLTWSANSQIVAALEKAFYKSFEFVEPSNKKMLLAVDVSGSMSSGSCAGASVITPREGATVLALTVAKTEPNYHIMGFSTSFVKLNITENDTLESAIRKTSGLPFSGTNCAQPMQWATRNKIDVDVFVVLTDSETWYDKHPISELNNYRKAMNKPDAKLVVVGMVGNHFTIADPNDFNTLDVVGFSTDTPKLISEFAKE